MTSKNPTNNLHTTNDLTELDGHIVNEGDFEKMYLESQAQLDRANAILAASKASHTIAPGPSVKAKMTAQRVRATVGELGFLNMSRTERLQSIGCDPTISDEFLRKLFGRGNNSSIGRDLHRTDPCRYALLREAALIINCYAT